MHECIYTTKSALRTYHMLLPNILDRLWVPAFKPFPVYFTVDNKHSGVEEWPEEAGSRLHQGSGRRHKEEHERASLEVGPGAGGNILCQHTLRGQYRGWALWRQMTPQIGASLLLGLIPPLGPQFPRGPSFYSLSPLVQGVVNCPPDLLTPGTEDLRSFWLCFLSVSF